MLLEPATKTDPLTEENVPDWDVLPTEHPDTPAAVDPLSSTEAVLTAGTVISRWVCYLPEDTVVESFWQVRWNGADYEIDGEVALQEGSREGYLTATLKRVEG